MSEFWHKLIIHDSFFILAFSLIVGIIAYLHLGRLVSRVLDKSKEYREEILRLMDLMFVETSPTRINQLMLLLSFGLALVVFFLLWPHFWLGIGVGILVGYIGWTMPVRIVKSMFDRRCSRLVEQMVDGLTIMANGVKAGLSVPQSMERVVENLGNPISQEFALVLSQVRLGRSVEEALLAFGDRIPKPDVQMFVTAINILKETGGNLAETFTTIVVVIRERQKVERKIEAMTAQGMTQGMIVSMVPIALILLFFTVDPAFIKPMFNTALGLVIFIVICALVIIGGVTMRKIVKIDV